MINQLPTSGCGGAAGFSEWRTVLDGWGSKMLAALASSAELVALGLGLPRDALTARMRYGPHLLGPTGALRP